MKDADLMKFLHPFRHLDRALADTSQLPPSFLHVSVFDTYWREFKFYKNPNFKLIRRVFNQIEIRNWLDCQLGLTSGGLDHALRWVFIQFRRLITKTDVWENHITTPAFDEWLTTKSTLHSNRSKRMGLDFGNLLKMSKYKNPSEESLTHVSPSICFVNQLPQLSASDVFHILSVPFYNAHAADFVSNLSLPWHRRDPDLVARVGQLCTFLSNEFNKTSVEHYRVPSITNGWTSILLTPYIYEQITLPREYASLWCVSDARGCEGAFTILPYGSPYGSMIVIALLKEILPVIHPVPIFANRRLYVYSHSEREHMVTISNILKAFSQIGITVHLRGSTWFHQGEVWEHIEYNRL